MAVFKAFKPEAMNKIAKAMGYTGDMGQFQSYIEQDPMRQQQMQRYTNAAMQMAKGGVVKMQQGGTVQLPQQAVPTTTGVDADATIGDVMTQQAFTPGVPTGGAVAPVGQVATTEQLVQPTVGQVTGQMAVPTAMAMATQAAPVVEAEAAQLQAI